MTSELSQKEETKRIAPGVCIPWEEQVKVFGEILGNSEMVKKEWENLDVAAYMYLWWWIHR